MEPKDYVISKIEGDYAYLRDVTGECSEDMFIALALLPPRGGRWLPPALRNVFLYIGRLRYLPLQPIYRVL